MADHSNFLGHGVGLRPKHYSTIIESKPKVDWFEVISENYMGVGGRPRLHLDKIRQDYPIVLHGVGLNIGSVDALRADYLKKLKELASWVKPALISDHLCWTGVGGKNTHDLLPLPYTETALEHVCERVSRVQEILGRSILLENPSAYVAFENSDMSEAEFLYELCRVTGCKVLLDLNNLFVNQKNLGWNPKKYFEILPANFVGQFHLAGHSISGDVRIDTHDHPVF